MQLLRRSIIFASFLVLVLAPPTMAQIVINEIMYNTPGSDVEYIELYNAGPSAVDLSGWYLLDGDPLHPPCPLDWTLSAGEFLVICADFDLFTPVYPDVDNLNPFAFDPGGTGFGLGNGGDEVNLFNDDDELMDYVAYDDGGDWPGSADGDGPSLELINPILDNTLPTSWDPSAWDGGTPGEVNSTFADNALPICKDGDRDIALPTSSDVVNITVLAHDAEGLASVQLFVDTGAGYVASDMFDDGAHGDGAANDSIFGASIPAQASGTLVRYYAVATDDIGQSDNWPNSAPAEYHAYTVDYVAPILMVTEVMASNATVLADEFGGYDDWLEIYNPGPDPVNLTGMYVTDSFGDKRESELPAVILNPGAYMLLWADKEPEQGPFHMNIKFSSGGETVAIFDTVDHGNTLIHGWKFGLMAPDASMGFNAEEATAPEYLAVATPGTSNAGVAPYSAVCINEFHTSSAYGGIDDWVEVYNRGEETVDISGCLLSDERDNFDKWAFPAGSVLAPGEFLTVYEDVLGFGFASDGTDVIMFTAPDSLTGLDFYDFGPQSLDISEGRYPDGSPVWQFFDEPTPGTANIGEVGVEDGTSATAPLRLIGNYPNPFNPRTEILFEIGKESDVSIQVYSVDGRMIRNLDCGELETGQHSVAWDGKDAEGHAMPSGVYFARVEAESRVAVTKMMMLK